MQQLSAFVKERGAGRSAMPEHQGGMQLGVRSARHAAHAARRVPVTPSMRSFGPRFARVAPRAWQASGRDQASSWGPYLKPSRHTCYLHHSKEQTGLRRKRRALGAQARGSAASSLPSGLANLPAWLQTPLRDTQNLQLLLALEGIVVSARVEFAASAPPRGISTGLPGMATYGCLGDDMDSCSQNAACGSMCQGVEAQHRRPPLLFSTADRHLYTYSFRCSWFRTFILWHPHALP